MAKKKKKSRVRSDLADLGYRRKKLVENLNTVQSVYAGEGVGKTHYLFTAPGPIAFINVDFGDHGPWRKFAEKRDDVYEIQVRVDPKMDPDFDWMSAWEELTTAYLEALSLRSMRGGTVGVDNMSSVYKICRMAFLHKLEKVPERYYGPVNAAMDSFCNAAKWQIYVNVIWLSRETAVYVNNERTEEVERKGYKEIGYSADTEIHLRREIAFDKEGEPYKKLCAEVMKCGEDDGLVGTVIRGKKKINFPALAALTNPGTKKSQWR